MPGGETGDKGLQSEMAGASGAIIVFNCAPAPLTEITAVMSGPVVTIFSSSQGIAPVSGVSPWVSGIRVPRGSGAGLFPDSGQISVCFDGDTQPAWTYTLTLPGSQSWLSFYLWCFINGYILGDQSGNIRLGSSQASLQGVPRGRRGPQEATS